MSPEERVAVLKQTSPDSWLALSADEERVVASGKTFSEAVENARGSGEADPVLIHIPENWVPVVV